MIHKFDFFPIAFCASVTIHAGIWGLWRAVPMAVESPVVQAPYSMEVALIENVTSLQVPSVEQKTVMQEKPAQLWHEPEKRLVPEKPAEFLKEPFKEDFDKLPVEVSGPAPKPMTDTIVISQTSEDAKSEESQKASDLNAHSSVSIHSQPQFPIESLPNKGVVMEAVPLEFANPAPEYPALARRKAWEGIVVLRVTVEKNGYPSSVVVAQTSGHRILDVRAMETIRRWRFKPAQSGGVDFASTITIPIQFQLIEEE